MQKWTRLDLRKANMQPRTGALTAMRMVEKRDGTERYEIGRLKPDPRDKRRKLWWYTGGYSVTDLARLTPRYDIWWYPVAEFDGF